MLKNQTGALLWNHDDKQDILQNYFKNLMGKPGISGGQTLE
jgi:hypothetical protein